MPKMGKEEIREQSNEKEARKRGGGPMSRAMRKKIVFLPYDF